MKKFFYYWVALCTAGLTIPSLFVAFGTVFFYGSGDAPSSDSPLVFGFGMFLLMFFTILQVFFWPAIVVLCIGLALFAIRSTGQKPPVRRRIGARPRI